MRSNRVDGVAVREVSVVGVGSTPFGKLAGQSIVELATDACCAALVDSNIPREMVQALYVGNFIGERVAAQGSLGPIIARRLGLDGIPATKVEAACASGGVALRHGYLMVAFGVFDVVIVAGVEKMSAIPTGDITAALATAGDEGLEMRTGLTFPGAFAMIMQAHMELYGTTRQQIALVSVKNHANGVTNPKAQFQKPTDVDEVMSSRFVAEPLRLFDCPPISDGAAAVVVTTPSIAHQVTDKAVRIVGSGQSSGPVALTEMEDLTTFPATVRAASEAFNQACLTPEHIDVAEVHDCFTIAEIVATEDLGLVPRGEGGRAVETGETHLHGRLPVNPSGGLIAKGHPVGASGVGQIYELVLQLRGEAANQIANANVGLAHSVGGVGAAATVHLLMRE